MSNTYSITRMFFEDHIDNREIECNLNLVDAKKHCQGDETSSSTANQETLDNERNKSGSVQWFDGFKEE